MIALHNNIPYVAKTIKRLFLPHDFGGKIEIDCFKKKHSTSVELEPEGYFSREIMMAEGEIIPAPFRFSKKFSKMYLPAGNKKQKENKLEDINMRNKKEFFDKETKNDARSEYAEMIIYIVRKIDNEDFLKFLYNMLELFGEKWGI